MNCSAFCRLRKSLSGIKNLHIKNLSVFQLINLSCLKISPVFLLKSLNLSYPVFQLKSLILSHLIVLQSIFHIKNLSVFQLNSKLGCHIPLSLHPSASYDHSLMPVLCELFLLKALLSSYMAIS